MENKKSKYIGVHWSSRDQKWRATITKYLGTFDDDLDAHKTYISYGRRLKLLDIKKSEHIGFDINVIKEIIEKITGLDISLKTRKQNFTNARQIYCKIARDYNPSVVTTTRIGEIINRDHATVIHSVKKAAIIIDQDPSMMRLYIKVTNIINKIIESNSEEEKVVDKELEDLKDDYKKQIEILKIKNKRLEPILDLLQQLPIEQINNFQETRLEPFIKMFEARKVLPKRQPSKY